MMANLGSNYPPGVTGNEYEIAGPDFESEGDRYCDQCEKESFHFIDGYRGSVTARCEECSNEIDISDEYGEDPDRELDEQREREL